MKITVHKCPWSGKLFEDPSKYRTHLKGLRDEQRDKREKARLAATFKEFVAPIYDMLTTDLIAEWLTENYPKIFLHYGPGVRSTRMKNPRFGPDDKVIFSIKPGTFKERCSTTHNAPLGKKTTGWRDEHIPEPGWTSRIDITFEGNGYKFFETEYLKYIGINTGCGGGSEKSLGYDLTLFIEDFRGLRHLAMLSHMTNAKSYRQGYTSDGKEIQTREKRW